MFKKFLSNAALSVAVDKKARKKIEAVNKRKRSLTGENTESNLISPHRSNVPDSSRRKQFTEASTLFQKNALDNTQGAKRESNSKPDKKQISVERKALIDDAMAIRRSKLHILNELDPDQLKKLTIMALHALNLRIQK